MARRSTLLFIALNLLLSSFYLDTWDNGNSASRMLAVYYAVNEGTFCIDKQQEKTTDKSFINGHYYSDKAPLPTFITIPFYKLLRMFGYPAEDNGKAVYILGTLVCAVTPFVIILWLLYSELRKRSTSISPVSLTLLPFYGSFIFIYSGTFYNHVLSALLLLLAWLHLKKTNYLLAGIFSGLAFLSEYIIAAVIAVWALQLLFNTKKIRPVILFSAGVVPSAIVIMIYNFIFTGSPVTMLYKFHAFEALHTDYGFSHPTLDSLWGLTFSQYKGLFFYTPFLLIPLFFFGKDIFSRAVTGRSLAGNYVLSCAAISLLLVSSYFGWWGGWAYGPRLLIFAVVLLVFEGALYIAGKKFSPLWVIGTGCAGLFITLAAKFTVLYSVPTEVNYPLADLLKNNVAAGNFNPNNLLSMLTGSSPVTAAICWMILFASVFFVLYRVDKKTVTS